jgi:hypothetical protein
MHLKSQEEETSRQQVLIKSLRSSMEKTSLCPVIAQRQYKMSEKDDNILTKILQKMREK